MLRIRLGVEDLGRIRFASAPAPVLETVLMLFELRHGPRVPAGADHDWRNPVRAAFPTAARPLFELVADRHRALFLDVLSADADEAFHLVRTTSRATHAENLTRIDRLNLGPAPAWLRRYADGDPVVLHGLDRALRSFHAACLAPRWSSVTDRFHRDVEHHTATSGRYGIAAMLNTLTPDVRLDGMVLEARSPSDRYQQLDGHGLILMPSAFWTGRPLFTWDPLDPSRYVLIYPARPGAVVTERAEADDRPGRYDALAALLGATRAEVLRVLFRPRTTSGIARYAGISLSSASEHAAVLRDAGLIASHRRGQSVEHHATDLGRALIRRHRPG
jgi:DNA-binding transcriptional ArsR family regulator